MADLDFDKFSGMTSAQQRVLIWIGRTIPAGSSISEEMLLDELKYAAQTIPTASANLTEHDFRIAIDQLVQ
jgi:hypothetical protein